MIRKASDTSEAIMRTVDEVKAQIDQMKAQLKDAEKGSFTERQLLEDIAIAQVDAKMMADQAKRASAKVADDKPKFKSSILTMYAANLATILASDEAEALQALADLRKFVQSGKRPIQFAKGMSASEEEIHTLEGELAQALSRILRKSLKDLSQGDAEARSADAKVTAADKGKLRIANILDKLADAVEDADLADEETTSRLADVEEAVNKL